MISFAINLVVCSVSSRTRMRNGKVLKKWLSQREREREREREENETYFLL